MTIELTKKISTDVTVTFESNNVCIEDECGGRTTITTDELEGTYKILLAYNKMRDLENEL